MPIGPVPMEFVRGPAPNPGPLNEVVVTEDSVQLGMAGLGSVHVTSMEVTVSSPDERSGARTWARLGQWATAQWLLTQGLAVLYGAAVAKDGRVLAITAASRTGASVTAAQLTRHGWGLVSDGVIALQADGAVLAGPADVHLDTVVAERLFPDYPQGPRESGRPRSWVSVPHHGDGTLHAYVTLIARDGPTGIAVNAITTDPLALPDLPEPTLECRSMISGITVAPFPRATSMVVRRSIPRSMEDLAEVGPPAMALAILDAVGEPR